MLKIKILLIIFVSIFIISSCSDNNVIGPDDNDLLHNQPGLVDSAVVNGCYEQYRVYYIEDLDVSAYRNIDLLLNGMTNSDGSFIEILCKTDNENYVTCYYKKNAEVNGEHKASVNLHGTKISLQVRLYIYPPVCGTGEFKYTRIRNLRVYGIK